MRFHQFCPEARRNPEQNPRKSGHSAAVEYLEKVGDLSHVGIRMTDIPKLGLNPQSTHNTPLGICFYPAEYYMDIRENNKKLPFQEEARYIQIFKWDSDKVLDLNTITEKEITQDILPRLAKRYGPDKVKKLWDDSTHDTSVKSRRIWYVMWKLTKSGQKWGHLLRKLGYDVVMDNGEGIIHQSEPTQGIVLNPRIITHMNQIQQTYAQDKNIARRKKQEEKIESAISHGQEIPDKLLGLVATNHSWAYQYAVKVLKGRFPTGESAIAKVPRLACQYAQLILKGRFPEGEPAIAKDPQSAYQYAHDVLKGPFPEGESAIAKDPRSAYQYAYDVLKGRFPAGEPAIANDDWHASLYAKNVLKDSDPQTWAQRYLAGQTK